MRYKFTAESPIFIQLSKSIEEDILLSIYKEGESIPSTTELSTELHINPATVLKAVNILVDEGILEKKRGIGMFVRQGSVEKIRKKKRNSFKDDFLIPILKEAKRLGLARNELISMIEEAGEDE